MHWVVYNYFYNSTCNHTTHVGKCGDHLEFRKSSEFWDKNHVVEELQLNEPIDFKTDYRILNS